MKKRRIALSERMRQELMDGLVSETDPLGEAARRGAQLILRRALEAKLSRCFKPHVRGPVANERRCDGFSGTSTVVVIGSALNIVRKGKKLNGWVGERAATSVRASGLRATVRRLLRSFDGSGHGSAVRGTARRGAQLQTSSERWIFKNLPVFLLNAIVLFPSDPLEMFS